MDYNQEQKRFEVAAYFAAGGFGAGVAGPIQRTKFLIIEFDDRNSVSRHEVRGSVFSSRTPSVEIFKSPQPGSGPPADN